MDTATPQELAEYERLYTWRALWTALAKQAEPGRLCTRQERIERRAFMCNLKIAKAMHAFDVRVKNIICPIDQKAVDEATTALPLAAR